ncbi:FkbM family methyltransferase [Serratia microhaemolytica]|uniref:FkbM family methyltransferase n=1 Tax=Serratia microhaemolytica TaxID=2675110 RepID=UPI0013922EC1|nr:FkbM family methyltransferase [Serratia microhaemolytica]
MRAVLPSKALHVVLRSIRRVPLLGRKMVSAFDPNSTHKVTAHVAKPKLLQLAGDGWKLNLNINDHIGYHSFIRNEPFEMTVFDVGQQLNLTEGDIVLDIGANIGTASIPLCAGKKLELIAVEASKENAALLLKNVLDNQIKAQVHMVALSDSMQQRYLKLYVRRGNTGANSIFENWSSHLTGEREFEFSPVMTLDALISNYDVDMDRLRIVKIDVEGAEELVLRGATQFLQRNTAPILLEYIRDAAIRNLNDDLSGVLKCLTTANYEIFAWGRQHCELLPFDPLQSYENIIALKKGSSAERILKKMTN